MGGEEWVGSFLCRCGAWCEEWHDHERHIWRVRHGEGEAVFTIGFDELIASLGESVGPWGRWLDRVHAYRDGAGGPPGVAELGPVGDGGER